MVQVPYKKRPLDRSEVEFRDSTLCVIASEDTYAVKQYFANFRTSRVKVQVLHTTDCRSSPSAVMNRLDEFINEFAIGEGDRFWLCIDLDHWAEPNHIRNLHVVLSSCFTKEYGVCICNPCFELWILAHFADPAVSQSLKCAEVEKQLSGVAGGYNKGKCCQSLAFTDLNVEQAISRARKLGTASGIPQMPQAPIYLILDEIRQKQRIELL